MPAPTQYVHIAHEVLELVNADVLLLVITITIALIFDFLNGFHDAANSIATVVSTRVLSPKLAVVWAAFFNFIAAFVLGTAVAVLLIGCRDNSNPPATAKKSTSATNNSSGNPVTAPVDYLGAVAKAKK